MKKCNPGRSNCTNKQVEAWEHDIGSVCVIVRDSEVDIQGQTKGRVCYANRRHLDNSEVGGKLQKDGKQSSAKPMVLNVSRPLSLTTIAVFLPRGFLWKHLQPSALEPWLAAMRRWLAQGIISREQPLSQRGRHRFVVEYSSFLVHWVKWLRCFPHTASPDTSSAMVPGVMAAIAISKAPLLALLISLSSQS